MTIKPIVAALGAALIACGSAASAAETQIYGVVSTGLYYQKAEGADHATVGMAAYKQTPTDSHLGLMGREDLGNGWYAGFQMESGWSLDSGALYDESRLFNRLARLFVGNEFIEVSAGRMSTFSCASEPYSVFKKLRANMTGSGLPGMAPALIVYNKGESDNTIAFATRAKDGFFLQGLYTNGSNDSETEYGWSDNNHVAQVAFGWTGRQLRIGSLLNWEMPEHTDATQSCITTTSRSAPSSTRAPPTRTVTTFLTASIASIRSSLRAASRTGSDIPVLFETFGPPPAASCRRRSFRFMRSEGEEAGPFVFSATRPCTTCRAYLEKSQ